MCMPDFVRWLSPLAVVISLMTLAPVPLYAAVPEVRGTWLTTTGSDYIRSGYNTAQTNGRLARCRVEHRLCGDLEERVHQLPLPDARRPHRRSRPLAVPRLP